MFDCIPSLIGGSLGVVNTLVDIHLFGFSGSTFLCDVFITILIVIVTNYFCLTNWNSISWIIAIVLVLMTFGGIYLYNIEDPVYMDELKKEKERRKI